jgi:hypothetical protein
MDSNAHTAFKGNEEEAAEWILCDMRRHHAHHAVSLEPLVFYR